MNKMSLQSLGYAQITCAVSTLISSALAAGIPAGTQMVRLQPQDKNIRYRDDGQVPTATLGMRLVADTVYDMDVAQVAAMRVIEELASAKLNITFYGLRV